MKHIEKIIRILGSRPVVSLSTPDIPWEASADYSSPFDAQHVYFELVQAGYDAACFGCHVNAYLNDDQLNSDDVLDTVTLGIERHLPDVCQGTRKEMWEEAFHLAHDWLIDNRHFGPEQNEAIALGVADQLFGEAK